MRVHFARVYHHVPFPSTSTPQTPSPWRYQAFGDWTCGFRYRHMPCVVATYYSPVFSTGALPCSFRDRYSFCLCFNVVNVSRTLPIELLPHGFLDFQLQVPFSRRIMGWCDDGWVGGSVREVEHHKNDLKRTSRKLNPVTSCHMQSFCMAACESSVTCAAPSSPAAGSDADTVLSIPLTSPSIASSTSGVMPVVSSCHGCVRGKVCKKWYPFVSGQKQHQRQQHPAAPPSTPANRPASHPWATN